MIYEFERGGVAGMEPHWRPQYAVGAFCDLKYDFIGVYKTILALSLLLSLNQFLIYSSLLYLLNFWILQLPTFGVYKISKLSLLLLPAHKSDLVEPFWATISSLLYHMLSLINILY